MARVRRVFRTRAVGHTGTLDPFATGLLVLLLGRATRLARFVERQSKTYLATARLGQRTETDDHTGPPIGPAAEALPPEAEVTDALAGFVGTYRQTAPRYSAKRVSGQRSHARARRGEEFEPPTSEVTIHALSVLAYAPPTVTFRVEVSAGTYVRALARDLGERLGVGAHLTALRREAIGTLDVADATSLDALSPATPLRAPQEVLPHLPTVRVDEDGRRAASHGRPLPGGTALEGEVAVLHEGALVAVALAEAGTLRPIVVLEPA